jgi:hypothetical protein
MKIGSLGGLNLLQVRYAPLTNQFLPGAFRRSQSGGETVGADASYKTAA